MNRYILVLGAALMFVGVGCASFDTAMQRTEDSLKKPLVPGTTQPTREETIQSSAGALGPWGTLAAAVGLYALHEYNSSRRNKKTIDVVKDATGPKGE